MPMVLGQEEDQRKVQSLTGWEGEPRSQSSDPNVVACINSQLRCVMVLVTHLAYDANTGAPI